MDMPPPNATYAPPPAMVAAAPMRAPDVQIPGYVLSAPPGTLPNGPIVAHMAAPGVASAPVTASSAEKGTDYAGMGYSLASNGIWAAAGKLGGPVTAMGGAVLGTVAANHEAKKRIEELIDSNRGEIATSLGIPAEQVNEQALRDFAEANKESHKALVQALEAIDNDKSADPTLSFASGATGMAVGGLLGGPVGLAAAFAVPWAVEKAGGALLGKRDYDQTAIKALSEMQTKWAKGEPVSAMEVFTVFVKMDEDFQNNLDEYGDKKFLDMSEEERIVFIRAQEPRLFKECEKVANAINGHIISPMQLQGVDPRQLIGEKPVNLASATPRKRRTTNNSRRSLMGTAANDDGVAGNVASPADAPRVVGPHTQQVMERRAAANENILGTPGMSA